MSQVNPLHNFYESEVISMKCATLYVKVTSQTGMATILGLEYGLARFARMAGFVKIA